MKIGDDVLIGNKKGWIVGIRPGMYLVHIPGVGRQFFFEKEINEYKGNGKKGVVGVSPTR